MDFDNSLALSVLEIRVAILANDAISATITRCYSGFCLFYFDGGNSKNGGGTQTVYFVRCHGYLR